MTHLLKSEGVKNDGLHVGEVADGALIKRFKPCAWQSGVQLPAGRALSAQLGFLRTAGDSRPYLALGESGVPGRKSGFQSVDALVAFPASRSRK